MHKQVAVGLIATVVATLAFAAVPAAQARGHFAAPPLARGAAGGHFGHFAAGVPHYAARAFRPEQFAPGRFRGPRFAGPRFAPDVRRFGDDHEHFRRFGWGGGYWGGQFWPRVYYGASFAWFLPVLAAYCPPYWWDDVPYYYCDDAYYQWSPEYSGYVAVDPPPVQDTGSNGPQNSAEDNSEAGAPDAAGAGGGKTPTYSNSTNAEVYAYPEHGQSEQQQQADRHTCAQWAASQLSSQPNVTVADYRRAMIACFEARGYSAQ